jgi:hypothetical protein
MKGNGFTAIELLVGASLAVMLILALAPLVTALQAAGTREADRTITVLQGRVAVARLERDLRMASAGRSSFAVEGPVLEATAKQIVFLGVTGAHTGVSVIEWEIVGSTLMRRWAPCPTAKPLSLAHGLYTDNKSMLEALDSDTRFSYLVNGTVRNGTVPNADLASVQGVVLRGSGHDASGVWSTGISCQARVGI